MSLTDGKHRLATNAERIDYLIEKFGNDGYIVLVDEEKKPISKEEEYKLFQFIDAISKVFPVGVGNLDMITVLEFYHDNRDELLERLIKIKNQPSFVDEYWKYARG